MMYILDGIFILWAIRILLNILSFIHLWYVKEYRIDRMMIHLGTNQGKRLYFLPWRRPPISPKTVTIFLATIIFFGLLFFVLPSNTLVKLIILDIFAFPMTGVFVVMVSIPTMIYHNYLIRQAIKKLRKHKEMIVIGITGSFGKTSTKEFLATILSSQYVVLKTEASKNSPIGIAELVLKSLRPETQVFIVEMGAYKKGEIAFMADMVRPQIGFVTAINAQHQDLFGSIEHTIDAKYELIRGLYGKRIAICNADNTYTRQMANRAKNDKREVWMYTKEHSKIDKNQDVFRAFDIVQNDKTLSFVVSWKNNSQKVTTPIIGEHFVANITAAIAGAVACGMDFNRACQSACTIQPITNTMQITTNKNGLRLINDTFNNNPDAARAAIEYLSKAKQAKILVFQPMIELGTYASKSHQDIGEYAANVCDEIILTNSNFYSDFMTGVARFDANKKVMVLSPEKAAVYIRRNTESGDTVLCKGKESKRVLDILQ